jgi:hypothetical protein
MEEKVKLVNAYLKVRKDAEEAVKMVAAGTVRLSTAGQSCVLPGMLWSGLRGMLKQGVRAR